MSEINLTAVRRILIFRIGELGDSLIALPSFRLIRDSFPDAHIALLSNLNSREKHVTPNQILPARFIDEWITYPSSFSGTRGFDMLTLLRTLRNANYDLLIYLSPRTRNVAAVKRDLLFFRLAGIRNVAGAEGLEALPGKVNGSPLPAVTHEADHLLERLATNGIGTGARGAATFDLELTKEEFASAEEWVQRNIPESTQSVLVGVGPGSKWPSKVWPEENFAELGVRLFARETQLCPVIFGGPSDHPLGDKLLRVWGRGLNAAGELTPRESAAVLSRCAFYVGNDTGTMHLAASVGTRCVAIMSAQDWPGRWNPYGKEHAILRKQVECEGCQLEICGKENLRCLTGISVDEVVHASRQLLEKATQNERVPQLA